MIKLEKPYRNQNSTLRHMPDSNEIANRTTNKYSVITVVSSGFPPRTDAGCDKQSGKQNGKRDDRQTENKTVTIEEREERKEIKKNTEKNTKKSRTFVGSRRRASGFEALYGLDF